MLIGKFFAASMVLYVALSNTSPLHAEVQNAKQQDAFDQRVHDYLLAHPEVISESLQKAQIKAEADRQSRTTLAIARHETELLHDDSTPILGNPAGDVSIVEFFDYRCPYCKASAPSIEALLASDPKVRVVLKEFPILGPDSVFASELSYLAWTQGKYRELHYALLTSKEKLDRNRIEVIARSVGLPPEIIASPTKSPLIDAALGRNVALGKLLGITGTPTFIVGNSIFVGEADIVTLRQLVATARAVKS